MSVEARFLEDSNGCWIFQGGRTTRGYGNWRVWDKATGKLVEGAHRSMWTIHFGTIPVGLQVLHRCDVKPCINPAHLYLGTHADNMRDSSERGHHRAPHPTIRMLTPDQVRRIRAHRTPYSLCRWVGIPAGMAWKIIRRFTYTDVSDA